MKDIAGKEIFQDKGLCRIAFGRTLPTIDQLKKTLAAEAMRRTCGNMPVVAKMLGISRKGVLRCLQNRK